ncbi:cell envelope biogenesis protein OmpA [Bacteroidia bacterium]|nr:cell envelope biogenesis protein OmpA [Bacteroidia bacterium]
MIVLLGGLLLLGEPAHAASVRRYQKQARKLEAHRDYKGALRLYNTIMTKGDSIRAMEGFITCYLALKKYDQAEYWLNQRVHKKNPYDFYYPYAEVLIHNEKYDEARQLILLDGNGERQRALRDLCDKAQNAMEAATESREYIVRNVASLNTAYDDWGAMPLGKFIYYCSDRTDYPNAVDSTEAAFTHLWAASPITKKNINGKDTIYNPTIAFESLRILPAPFNVSGAHSGTLSYSPKNVKEVYFSQSNRSVSKNDRTNHIVLKNLGIYSVVNALPNGEEEAASNPALTSFNHNSIDYSVSHPCFNSAGNILYFASNMPNGFGGTDIWYSERVGNGWGAPKNCGANINTAANELFPTMDSEGKLYFSSNRLGGLGGWDIYEAKGSKDKWSNIEAMPYPINSSGDDFYLVKMPDNMRGFFSSNRIGGKGGDDIYTFAPRDDIKDPLWMDVATSVDVNKPYLPAMKPVNVAKTQLFPASILNIKPIVVEQEKPAIIASAPINRAFTVQLTGAAIDAKSQAGIKGAKICITRKETHASVCKQTDAKGWAIFDLENDAEYYLSAFKSDYISPALTLINAATVIPDKSLPIVMQRAAGDDFVSTDAILKKEQKKAKKKTPTTVRRNQTEYRVQVLALSSKSDVDWSYFHNLRKYYPQFKVQMNKNNGVKRYTYGSFSNEYEALRYMNRYLKLGYGGKDKACFVTVHINGVHVENIYSGGSRQRMR